METYCDNEYLYECIMKTDPAPCGLYPHEIIFLRYFTFRLVRLDIPVIPNAYCMHVNYSQLLLKSMIDRGFIKISNNDDIEKIINMYNSKKLREILKSKFSKIPRKKELIVKLALSIPKDELNNILGTRFYVLTEKGYDVLKNNKNIIENMWGNVWNKDDLDISQIKKNINIIKINEAKIEYKNNIFFFGLNDVDILCECNNIIYFEYPVEIEVVFGNANYRINATEFKILNKLNGIILIEEKSENDFHYTYISKKGIELEGNSNSDYELISSNSDYNTVEKLNSKYNYIRYNYKNDSIIKIGDFEIYCCINDPLVIEILSKKDIGAKINIIHKIFENDYSVNVSLKLNADNYYAISLIAYLIKTKKIRGVSFFGIEIIKYYQQINIFKSSNNKLQSLIALNDLKLFNDDNYCNTILKVVNKFKSLSSFCDCVCKYIPYSFVVENIDAVINLYDNEFNIKNNGYLTNEEYDNLLKKWKKEYKKNLMDLYNDGTIAPKWKNEYLLYFMFSVVFEDTQYQYRAKWLGLQSLDIYIPSLNIGIEYQGQQHYKPVDYFGGEEKLNEQKERDLTKKKLCVKNGIKLLEWKYDTDVNIENFNRFLKDNDIIGNFDINEKNDMPILKNIKNEKKKETVIRHYDKTVICQYDKIGTFIKQYKTIKDASIATNTSYSGIQRTIAGQQNSAGNFLWKKCYLDDIPKSINPIKSIYSNNNISQEYLEYQIKQLDKVSGEVIDTFENMTQASKITGIDYTSIRRTVSGKQKSAGGYKWIKIKKNIN